MGEPRPEVSFASHTAGGWRTARRIRFSGEDLMTLNLMDFNFSLQVASERREDVLTYRYDPASDSWSFVQSEATP